tara:strand:+ start:2877 stop:3896 length:1020 start_codon:yes stop_codon:yes gene_type:complete
MSTIKWNPILAGEEISGNKISEVASDIASTLNSISSENVADRAFGIDSFAPGHTEVQQKQRYDPGPHRFDEQLNGWRGNPSSNEEEDCRDPKWSVRDTSSADPPPQRDQITTYTADKNGWKLINQISFDTHIDLMGDNSNSILVMAEAHCTELHIQEKVKPASQSSVKTKTAATPHALFFTILCANIRDSDNKIYAIPLPSTLRFIDGDTNTNNSADSNSGWISEVGIGARGRNVTGLRDVRKNMPVRTLVTFDDVNSMCFLGDTPVGAARRVPWLATPNHKKRIEGFTLYGSVKTGSGHSYYGPRSDRAFATVRESLVSAIYLDSRNKTRNSTDYNYP